jgi:hypothetical protein
MNHSLANLSAPAQWLVIGEFLIFVSTCLVALAMGWMHLDRWLVSIRGIAGTAVIKDAWRTRTLPRQVWELRVEVTPDDRPASFSRRVSWFEGEFESQTQTLTPGIRLRVRFRRGLRPIVVPMRMSRRSNSAVVGHPRTIPPTATRKPNDQRFVRIKSS